MLYKVVFNKMRVTARTLFPVFWASLLVILSVGFIYASDADFAYLIKKKGAPAKELIEKPTLYRETELNGLPCTASDFEFLLDRPRSSIALAGKMHKSLDKYTIDSRKPGELHIDDQGNLVGDMELVINRPGKRMYYITGYWKLVLGMKLEGRMALVVDYKEVADGNGRALDAKARGYMMVDNSVAGEAFKVLAFMFPGKVDARINRFATAVEKVVVAVHDDPEGVCKRLEGAQHVPPEEAREFRARFGARKAG